jgi:IS30 family transposase
METVKRGRPINEELRESIRTMLAAGKSQAAIARELDRAPSTIAQLVRAIGIPAKEYGSMTERDGKRLCTKCRKYKTPGAFPTDRDTICRVCFGQ